MKGRTIAVTGKGGVGKTLLSALLIRILGDSRPGKSILAIDADPDSNLAESLGVELQKTVGDIREDMLREKPSPGVEKKKYLDAKVFEITVETDNFDLLVMGRPEGQGCYCAINHMLREIIDNITKSYDYIVIDAEAGLEHLSRRTTENVDSLLVISDASNKGLDTARRIKDLTNELNIKFNNLYLILNRVTPKNKSMFEKEAGKLGIEIIGSIPDDPEVSDFDLRGKPITDISPESAAYTEAKNIVRKLTKNG